MPSFPAKSDNYTSYLKKMNDNFAELSEPDGVYSKQNDGPVDSFKKSVDNTAILGGDRLPHSTDNDWSALKKLVINLASMAQDGPAPPDPDAISYRDAVLANGGTIDDPVFNAVEEFVVGCKADSIWTSLLDVGLFAGVGNLNGALVKLKTPSGVSRILTNVNFVSGDYTATGASAGMLGNATSKYLDTLSNPSVLGMSKQSSHIMVYARSQQTGDYQTLLGARNTGPSNRFALGFGAAAARGNSTTGLRDDGANTNQPLTAETGALLQTATSATATVYRNGTSLTTGTAGTVFPNLNCVVFANRSAAGSLGAYFGGRISCYSIGTGLDGTQAAALSARVNTLMTAFGANVY